VALPARPETASGVKYNKPFPNKSPVAIPRRRGFFYALPCPALSSGNQKTRFLHKLRKTPNFFCVWLCDFESMEGAMEPLLDINDVERITKIKKATLRRYVLLKQIPFHKVIKAIRFRASEIEAWVNNNGSLAGLEVKSLEGELSLFDGIEGEASYDGN
jgi:predicted DNA-binding transcriptional regulator AlpA